MSQEKLICPVCGGAYDSFTQDHRCGECGFEYAFVESFSNLASLEAWNQSVTTLKNELRDRMVALNRKKPILSLMGGNPVYRAPGNGQITVFKQDGMHTLPEVMQYSAACDPPAIEAMLLKDGTVQVSGIGSRVVPMDRVKDADDVDYVLTTDDCVICKHTNGALSFYGQCTERVQNWSNVLFMTYTASHFLGLTGDRRVLVDGPSLGSKFCNIISSWTGVVELCSSDNAVMALHDSGRVSFASYRDDDERSEQVAKWPNVQGIALDNNCAYGLTTDGSILVAIRGRLFGSDSRGKLGEWRNIIAISGFQKSIAALEMNGTIHIAGNLSCSAVKQEYWNREADRIRKELVAESYKT